MNVFDVFDDSAVLEYSDVFITAGKPVSCRKNGSVIPLKQYPVFSVEEINAFRQDVIGLEDDKLYREKETFDASLSRNGNRFRLNFYETMGGPALVARPIRKAENLTFESLGLPEDLKKICESPRGLILVAGTTGSGKSTTVAAMVNHINKTKSLHVLTLEDPIEYLHKDQNSLISQREINTDTSSFFSALRSALRENPDVIVVGEMRDMETMQVALNAALTGHLVISTVHTADTILATERIINMFPESLQTQAAIDLGMAMNAIIAQRLIPSTSGDKMVPAVEILTGSPTVKKQIENMDYSALEDTLHQNSGLGMMKFNRAILNLYQAGKITLTDARQASSEVEELNLMIQGMERGVDSFRNNYGYDSGDSSEIVDLRRLLRTALIHKASDLHLSCGVPPNLRINGALCPMELPPLMQKDIQRLLFSVVNQRQRIELEEKRELDFALSITMKGTKDKTKTQVSRFRVNAFYQRGSLGVVCRVVNVEIPTPDELHLPVQLVRMAHKQQGLILITGPTGSGKSTTLASLINRINEKSAKHIITLEDPIEYVHKNINSIIEQRELHSDTLSFATALRFALRQDPDVIMVGEMRDPETMAAALTAAETGHLVFATVHTNSAPQTIDRIVDSFQTSQQNQIRMQLSGVLLGVLSQRLLPRLDGNGRVAAFELMTGTPPILALVRDGKTHQLQSVIETSQKDGMCTLEKSLEDLYNQGIISEEQKMAYRADYQQVKEF